MVGLEEKRTDPAGRFGLRGLPLLRGVLPPVYSLHRLSMGKNWRIWTLA